MLEKNNRKELYEIKADQMENFVARYRMAPGFIYQLNKMVTMIYLIITAIICLNIGFLLGYITSYSFFKNNINTIKYSYCISIPKCENCNKPMELITGGYQKDWYYECECGHKINANQT